MTDYSGLIVPLPELEPVVSRWRGRYDTQFADTPAHVSVLFPWLPPDRLAEADLDAVGQLAKQWQPFEVCFARFATFDDAGVDYLAPEPADDFLALTEDLCTVWPEYPPYEAAFAEVVPHLTVSVGRRRRAGRGASRRRHSPAAGTHHGPGVDRRRGAGRPLPGPPVVPAGWPETLTHWPKSAWQAVGGLP